MLFAAVLNLTPAMLGFMIYRSLKTGEISRYVNPFGISRAENPTLFVISLIGVSCAFLITFSFAIYVDILALLAHLKTH